MQPTLTMIDLTPARAAELLTLNTHNRHLSRKTVAGMAEAMRRGEWRFNGDPIRLDDQGRLADGQYRCSAVVRSGVTIRTILVTGLDPEVQDTIDVGRSRTLADVLTLRNEVNTAKLAAAINWLFRLDSGSPRSNTAPTHAQALELLDREPGLRDAVRVAMTLTNALKATPGLFGALMHAFARIDTEDAEDFARRLRDGDVRDANDPVFRLRSVLINELTTLRAMPTWKMAALTIKAWNAYRDGEEVRQLRFTVGGASPEAFPVPR